MKLVRLSVIYSFFRASKNLKKFLLIVNLGIFLSIFATSAGLISFFVEKKINDVEYEIVNTQILIRNNHDDISHISKIRMLLFLMMQGEKDIRDLYEYIAIEYIPNLTISVNDIYLPDLVINSESQDFKYFEDLIESKEYGLEVMREMFVYFYGQDSNEIKDFDKISAKFKEIIPNFKKNYNKYYNKVFDFNQDDLIDEMLDKKSIRDFNDPIYLDYTKMFKSIEVIEDFFILTEKFAYDLKLGYEENLKELNSDLIKLSNNEKKIIIFAFLFQIIMFLIIQIFEVTSMQRELKRQK